jgi:hypothetical protein
MTTLSDGQRDEHSHSFIAVLQRIDAAAGADGLTVAEIVDRFDERAFGLLILVFSIPCLVPGLPGAQIIAIPIFLLAAQLFIDRSEPWLPRWFMRIRVKKGWIEGVASFADKRLRWSERLARPRLGFLAEGWGERITALIMTLAAITVMLPITNTVPSTALVLMSVGLIQRDGLFTLAGAAVATAWLTLLGALIAGLFFGAGFAMDFAADHAPWLLDLLGR